MCPTTQRPLIGVTTYRQVTAWWSWERDAAVVPGTYLDVIDLAGGQPLLIPPSGVNAESSDTSGAGHPLEHVVSALDGLVLIGGGDLEPQRYGQRPDARTGGHDSRRDELELALIGEALDADLPVLAVCRGAQLLNVALGGDLVQYLPDRLGSRHQPRPGAFGEVGLATSEDSLVRRCVGERLEVLCSHHQAIATLGAGLRVTALSDDGLVEAVELPTSRFVVGEQWHPEESGDRRLFDALVEEASRRASGRKGRCGHAR